MTLRGAAAHLGSLHVLLFYVCHCRVLRQAPREGANASSSCYPAPVPRRYRLPRTNVVSGRYLVMLPREDGMNNQIQSVVIDLATARREGRTVVLPYLLDHCQWNTTCEGPFSFSRYFDLLEMRKQGISFTTPSEVVQACSKGIYVDSIPHRHRLIDLYESSFGFRFLVTSNATAEACVSHQHVSQPPGFPPYSQYASHGQGWSLADGFDTEFALATFALAPAEPILAEANYLLSQMPERFNALHLRRGDYERHCRLGFPGSAEFSPESCFQSKAHIRKKIAGFAEPLPLFVTTDDPQWAKKMFGKQLIRSAIRFRRRRPAVIFVDTFAASAGVTGSQPALTWDQSGMVEQIICANAENFIANRFSSFSARINNMRLECHGASHGLLFWG